MDLPPPIIASCTLCEGRRFVGDGADTITCPGCSCFCSFCVDVSETAPRARPRVGSLVAGILKEPGSDRLFRGYACDLHKGRLRTYSFIARWMVDSARFQLGTPYLIAGRRVFVVLYGVGEAENWQELEADARAAVGPAMRHGQAVYFPCPTEIAARARPPAWFQPDPLSGGSGAMVAG